MEGQKEENWWFGEYPNYSLTRYKDMPVYQRFISSLRPFTKIMGEYREAFWKDENCFIFEWFDSSEQKGEKFGLDHNSTTYFYEHWFTEDDIHIVEKSWLCDPSEWGLIIKYYPEYSEEVTWTMENDKKVVETRVQQDNKVKLKTDGQKLTPDGLEDFTEIFWETPTGYAKERSWTRGEAKGEEKEYKEGDKKWGESWIESDDQTSRKTWHEEGSKRWGEGTGEEGYEKWKEKWDKTSQGSFEEIEYEDRFQNRGKLRVRSKSGEYKLEWEGAKPEIKSPNEEEKTSGSGKQLKKKENQKLRSGKRPEKPAVKFEEPESQIEPCSNDPVTPKLPGSDPITPKVSDSEKLAFQLSGLFKDLKKDVLARLAELKPELIRLPELSSLVEEGRKLKDPNPFDPQDAFAGIQAVRDLDRKLLNAERALFAEQPTMDQLKNLFNSSANSLLSLSPVLDPSNLSQIPSEVQRLSQEFESNQSPKDKIGTISALNPKYQDLLRASKQEVEDHHKELAEISFKLSPVLKDIEEVIKESQGTLVKIQEGFAKDGETFEPFIQGFINRAKEWIQALENNMPYTETVPQVVELLVDMEKLKKEMIQNDLTEKCEKLLERVGDINQKLSDHCGEQPEVSGKNLHDFIATLENELEKASQLIAEKLNEDSKGKSEESDNKKQDFMEKWTVDPIAVLKKLWLDGQNTLGNLSKALNTLGEAVASPEEKQKIAELADHCNLITTGITPESKPEALEQLASTLDEFMPCLNNSTDLLQSLTEKLKSAATSAQGDNKDLWTALLISDKITDKISPDRPETEEFKSPIDSIPDNPSQDELKKALVKIQEINLKLLNNNEELTNKELDEVNSLANRRPKKKTMQKKGNKALRSGRGDTKKSSSIEPLIELIESSYKTTSELVLWVLGSRPNVLRQLDSLKLEKQELIEILHKSPLSPLPEQVLSFLQKLEDAKQGTYTGSDIPKNFSIILQKCEKVLETTEKIVGTPIPDEVSELQKRTMVDNIPEYSKRIGFYLSIFFKMVKDATGVDEGEENLQDALSEIKKKQARSMLPFDSEQLLSFICGRSQKDIKRLKFLAGLVGTDGDIEDADQLEEQADSTLPDLSHSGGHDSLAQLDYFLQHYPEIGSKIEGKTGEFLQKLVEKLVNPEPLEKDVSNLIETIEKQSKTLEKLKVQNESLEKRKDYLPTSPKDLIPYLSELSKDYSSAILDKLGLTPEESSKLNSIIGKKLKVVPLQVVRDIQHLFRGPDTDDMVIMIVKLNKVTSFLLKDHTVGDPALYSMCNKDFARLALLTPLEVKALGKDFADVLLSFIETDPEELMMEESEMMRSRSSIRGTSTVAWETIFHNKGLDLDTGLLCEIINEEQELAMGYLLALPRFLGAAEQKKWGLNLKQHSEDIRKDLDMKSKIEDYFQLRLEESKLAASLCQKLQVITERLEELDKEKETTLSRTFAEVTLLVEQNDPLLKEQVSLLFGREQEHIYKEPANAQEFLMRLANRLALEKELQRIKDEAKPKNNENEELVKALTSIETTLYLELRNLNQFLQTFSADLLPGTKSLKHLTEQDVSTTVPALLASLNTGLKSHGILLEAVNSTLSSCPVRTSLNSLIKLLQVELQKDDLDTEAVFSGLFRLCGSAEDKSVSKKLRESRTVSLEEKLSLYEQGLSLHENLNKVLPARSGQSKLQNKLIKEVAKLRDGIDDLDVTTEELINRALREAANSILPEDSKSKELLDRIKKNIENLSEKSPTNIPDHIERIANRLEEADKIEKLRRELREKGSKEINRLKGEVQDKLNEISTLNASLDAQKTGFDAQIALLQNSANLNASLVEKLTGEAVEKEKNLSAAKNVTAELKAKNEDLEEELDRNKGDIDSINQEIRNLRKVNKEKDAQIRDLTTAIDAHERSSDKFSLGDREKSEILEKLQTDNRNLKLELEENQKKLEDLQDSFSEKERNLKKCEIEKGAIEAELEKTRAERSSVKADLMKLKTEKLEIEEKLKMNEGSDEVKQLERILDDKQKQLEETEAKLTVAKRYQALYPELTVEKQEVEGKLREVLIDLEEIKRKFDDLRSENEQNKYKLVNCENLTKNAEELSRENQKLKIRITFLERSTNEKDSSELNKQLAENVSNKEAQIQELLAEIERLKKLLNEQIRKFRASLTRNFLIRLCHIYLEMERQGFSTWRNYKQASGLKLDLLPKVLMLEEQKEGPQNTEEALARSSSDLFSSNPLIKLFKEVQNTGEKPMSRINVFRFLEDLFDKKFEVDKQDERDSKALMSVPEFMMEHLMKTFGTQSIALKFLSQLIPGLYEIYKEGHKYAEVFSRLLQIFHPEPAPLVLAVFVTKARMDFFQLVDKNERSLESDGRKERGKVAYEAAGNGGKALVGDVIELVYRLFTEDHEGGEKVLEMIKPEKVKAEDFVAYKICHKMAKLGKTPEMIFNLLDKDQGGTIDSKEFTSGTKNDLDLWISDKNIGLLVQALDSTGTQEISKESFMSKINMRFLLDCNKNPVWTVTKARFLEVLLDVFVNKRKTVFNVLEEKAKPSGIFNKDTFAGGVNELEPNVGVETVEKMFDEAKDKDKVVKLQAAGEVASKYGLGGLNSFKSRELMQELHRRKLVNITEDESIHVSTRSKKTSFVEGNVRIDRDEEEKTIIRKKVVKKLVKRIVG